eukprot:m.795679 g.795679  ORF g.795679 m.795679 type:complete len:107 (-) comp59245_c0_seq4:2700-3020(-)
MDLFALENALDLTTPDTEVLSLLLRPVVVCLRSSADDLLTASVYFCSIPQPAGWRQGRMIWRPAGCTTPPASACWPAQISKQVWTSSSSHQAAVISTLGNKRAMRR